MAALPKGSIILWYGSIATIPAGFVLCNGANDTPDLRNKFIAGAGLTYAVGATGGAVDHTHAFTSDGHYHEHVAGPGFTAGAVIDDQTSTDTDSGTTNSESSLPPYHALAYVMKT